MAPRRGAVAGAALSTAEVLTFLVAAHTWAGGRLPAPAWVALTGVLLLGGALLVQRHRVPLVVAVPVLVAAQLLLHGWLVALAGDAAAHPAAHAGGHAHATGAGATDVSVVADLGWPMVLAHVAGGVVTALVWELRRRAVDVVVAWLLAGLVPVPALRRVLTPGRPAPRPRRPVVVVPLRGPPVGPVPA